MPPRNAGAIFFPTNWSLAEKKCLFPPVKQRSFYGAIITWTGRRLGSTVVFKSCSAAIIQQRDKPRHLFSHLSAHIHFTKRVCVSGSSFTSFGFFFISATAVQKETFDEGTMCYSRYSLHGLHCFSTVMSTWKLCLFFILNNACSLSGICGHSTNWNVN